MHKFAEKIAECLKAKVEAKGIDNIEGQDLVELGMWTDIIKDLVCYDKDKKIIVAMDEAEETEDTVAEEDEEEEDLDSEDNDEDLELDDDDDASDEDSDLDDETEDEDSDLDDDTKDGEEDSDLDDDTEGEEEGGHFLYFGQNVITGEQAQRASKGD